MAERPGEKSRRRTYLEPNLHDLRRHRALAGFPLRTTGAKKARRNWTREVRPGAFMDKGPINYSEKRVGRNLMKDL